MKNYRTAAAACLSLAALSASAANLLTDAGFENGSTGWTFSAGSGSAGVSSDAAHGGSAAAALTGWDSSITQTFAATLVSAIGEVSLYALADGGAYDQVVFGYADGSSSTSVLFGLGDEGWTQYDVTSDLIAGETLVGITIYGASGKTVYLDDVVVGTVGAVPETASAALFVAGLAGVAGVSRRRR